MTKTELTPKRKMIYADLSLLLVALVWGGGFVVMKGALDNITPFYIMAVRFTLATAIMCLILNKRLRNITKKDLYAGAVIGILLFLGFSAQTIGLQYTTASKQAFLTGTNVVIVPFLAWMVHKQRPDGYAFSSTFLALIGIGLLTIQGSFFINKGDLLTLICAVFFAAHIVSVGYFAKGKDPFLLAFVQMAVAALIFSIFALIFEPVPRVFDKQMVSAVAYLVLFPTLMAFVIQNTAQQFTTSTRTALILCLESVFGTILAVMFLKEMLTIQMIAGCVLILIAIVLAETKLDFLKNRKRKLLH